MFLPINLKDNQILLVMKMKYLVNIRSIFRAILLISLIFRLYFVEKLSYTYDLLSYILLALGLLGMIIFEVLVYKKKKDEQIR